MHVHTSWYQGKNHMEGTNSPAFSRILGYNAMSRKIEEEAKKNLHFFKHLFSTSRCKPKGYRGPSECVL